MPGGIDNPEKQILREQIESLPWAGIVKPVGTQETGFVMQLLDDMKSAVPSALVSTVGRIIDDIEPELSDSMDPSCKYFQFTRGQLRAVIARSVMTGGAQVMIQLGASLSEGSSLEEQFRLELEN